jgi:arginine/lysine/ornithine decarboxylase
MDVTVFPEVDSLHDPVGPIKKAQQLMAMAYGVEHSFFLVNGSSVGNMSMLMSACRPGDSVIISRNAHKSTMAGVILSGVWPIWIQPKVDQNLDILFDSSPEQIEEALGFSQKPRPFLSPVPPTTAWRQTSLKSRKFAARAERSCLWTKPMGPI